MATPRTPAPPAAVLTHGPQHARQAAEPAVPPCHALLLRRRGRARGRPGSARAAHAAGTLRSRLRAAPGTHKGTCPPAHGLVGEAAISIRADPQASGGGRAGGGD